MDRTPVPKRPRTEIDSDARVGEASDPRRNADSVAGVAYDQWTGALHDAQIGLILTALGANPEGSLDELRNRLSRATRRVENPTVPWTSVDEMPPIEAVHIDHPANLGVSRLRPPPHVHAGTERPGSRHFRVRMPPLNTPAMGSTRTGWTQSQGVAGEPAFASSPLDQEPRRGEHLAYNGNTRQTWASVHRPRMPARAAAMRYHPGMIERVNAWHIEFRGTMNENVETFIRRLEQCRASCGLMDDDLYNIMPLILKDVASNWWTVKNSSFTSYSHFLTELRRRFGVPAERSRLIGEVVSRTQGRLESSIDFLDAVRTMWLHAHSTIPLRDQLDITFNNFRAEYHQEIRQENFATFEELEALVLNFDMCRRRPAHRPPPPIQESVLPDCAYHESRYINSNSRERRVEVAAVTAGTSTPARNYNNHTSSYGARGTYAAVSGKTNDSYATRRESDGVTDASGARRGTPVQCFNCGETGHRFRNCKKERVLFCWKCGKRGVRSPECPQCNPLEKRRQATTSASEKGNAGGERD